MEVIEIIVIVFSVTVVFAVFTTWLKKKLKNKGECSCNCSSCDGICKEKIQSAINEINNEIKANKN